MLFTRHFLGAKSKNTNVWTIIGCDRVASTRTNQLQACADMRCRNYGGEIKLTISSLEYLKQRKEITLARITEGLYRDLEYRDNASAKTTIPPLIVAAQYRLTRIASWYGRAVKQWSKHSLSSTSRTRCRVYSDYDRCPVTMSSYFNVANHMEFNCS